MYSIIDSAEARDIGLHQCYFCVIVSHLMFVPQGNDPSQHCRSEWCGWVTGDGLSGVVISDPWPVPRCARYRPSMWGSVRAATCVPWQAAGSQPWSEGYFKEVSYVKHRRSRVLGPKITDCGWNETANTNPMLQSPMVVK